MTEEFIVRHIASGNAELGSYLAHMNALLTAKGLTPYGPADLRGEMNQLKVLIDLCHQIV